ncbi:MAG TPA: family 78 glycoside hydrolase catalytic domain, partial [Verrucomicrobiae bacterium]|nr:family 78 glycoside hydrolase catalytic domain [Verrucomicrobiae bacterium]
MLNQKLKLLGFVSSTVQGCAGMKRSKQILTLGVVLLAGVCSAAVATKNLRCEYLTDPLGIDAASPRLSWILTSDQRDEEQTAYQILVASSAGLLNADTGDLWDSGKVASDESCQIAYAGKALASRESCFWKVRAWGRDGHPGAWSSVARWQMGLLEPADWSAKWIAPKSLVADTNPRLIIRRATYGAVTGRHAVDVTAALASHVQHGHLRVVVNNETMGVDPAPDVVKHLRVEYQYGRQSFTREVNENQTLVLPESSPLPYVRKSFELQAPVQRAVLYVTALGLYEVHINGRRVGDHVLAPDWTDYRQRVRYQAYDVTALLKAGRNAMGALLANGWFSGHIGNGGYEFFGKEPAFLAQLELTYADGHTEQIVTDDTWKWHDSPIRSSDFMLGEDYDARLEIDGWDQPGLDERRWLPVGVRDESFRKLESQVMEPVRQICELKAKTVARPKPGCWVYDLGQNMVGVVRLKVSAAAGTKVTLHHAEMLNPDGTLYTNNLRGAPSIDHYVCKGDGVEIWQPRFTFHGFRYVEITGLYGPPDIGAVTGIVIGSDIPRTGEFACSDPRL